MELDPEDPLQLFNGSPPQACIGAWKNDQLQVRISLKGGRLLLDSGKTELLITETGPNLWSVATLDQPDVEVYTAGVRGYGRRTRLTLHPPRHKGGDKKAVLRRVEHLEAPAVLPPPAPPGQAAIGDRMEESRGSSPAGREEQLALRDRSEAGGPRRRAHAARSASRGSRRGGARRSRSPCRGRSPPRKRQQGEGNGEEITTLFVSGLPGDTREEDVRIDLEEAGTIVRVVLMRRGSERNAFVRFETLREAEWAMDRLLDGKLKVCGARVKAEIARRNTN